jgi:alpha-L-rhamnosidase
MNAKAAYLTLAIGLIGSLTCFSLATNKVTDPNKLAGAKWIGDNKPLPSSDSLYYLNDAAPEFRKTFKVGGELRSAKLFITAAGYYVAKLNGKKIGKSFLDPAWTTYSKRIYYSTYDITSQILPDQNSIVVSIGNGFYNPLPLRMWGTYNLRKTLSVGRPAFIAKLVLIYKNGHQETINTDSSWKFATGPILRNSVYLGEVYDARKKLNNWSKVSTKNQSWTNASVVDGPGGNLQKAFFPAIHQTEFQKPIKITTPKPQVYVVDMGKNYTGLYKIRLRGKEGEKITLRFGERIYTNGELNPMTAVCGQIKKQGRGGPGAPAIAWQSDEYIFGKEKEVWYSPQFTFHVFRYIEITGLTLAPKLSDIQGIVLHTNVKSNGTFNSSSLLLNSIQNATRQTFVNNLMSVQSDCPGRERFGYGGDLNATSESFICNFNMQQFYRKTIYDWTDVVMDTAFVDVAPFVMKYCGISWESALLTTQYNLYKYYNDTAIVNEMYDFDLKWMDKAARIHPTGMVHKGLADHESMIPVPVELIGTSHYLQCAHIMKQFATLKKDKTNELKFGELEKNIASQLVSMFWQSPIKSPIKSQTLLDKLLSFLEKNTPPQLLNIFWKAPIKPPINKQTLFATLLYHNLIPEKEKQVAADSLLNALKNGVNGHFTTGIFGTKYILEALSQAGYADKVFDIVNSREYPGWGFMIDKGATTLWETWKESEDTYSNCHPMFGTVSEWSYRWLGGIRQTENQVGFKKFIIAPFLPKDLKYVNCSYKSPQGLITSNWEKTTPSATVFKIRIPKSSEAEVSLPFDKFKSISLVMNSKMANVKHLNSTNIKLTEGTYHIEVIQ